MTAARSSGWLVVGWLAGGLAWAEEPPASSLPPPTLICRAVRPHREIEAILRLFAGSRAASPAAALSAWKRASVEPKRLGKVGDALIATFNPAMIREWENLNEAVVAFSRVPGTAQWSWRACFPHDDGTLAALGPTADLSGGGVEPPIGAYRVDRFPGADLVLLARGPAGLVAANSREQLELGVHAVQVTPTVPPIDSGWLVQLDPAARDNWNSLAGRRWAEAARTTGCVLLTGRAQLVRTSLVATLIGRFGSATPVVPPIDPDWLNGIPTRGPLAAAACRVDPRAESWGRVFGLLDRIERTDPARSNVAPARIRLALAALVAGVRLEADLWPHLIGVSGWVGAGRGQLDRGTLALHLDQVAVGRTLVAGLKGRRVRAGDDEVVELATLGGQPLHLVCRQATLFLNWGERAWGDTRAALDDPTRSARSWLERSRTGALPTRAGAIWLDQLPQVPPGTPLAAALAESRPLQWAGGNEGNRTWDEFWVDGLDATIRRFLDQIPLDPPPAS